MTMKVARTALAAALLVPVVFFPTPAEGHDCTKEEPRCFEVRTLLEKPERQEIKSRVLGHHCAMDGEERDPNADHRVLSSRIGVVFSDVTRTSGFLETITIYFEGDQRQITGALDAIGRRNDWHHYDGRGFDPGLSASYRVGKRVEFGHARHKKIGSYDIWHSSMASEPEAGYGETHGGGREPTIVGGDCEQKHYLLLDVVPPSEPSCQRRNGPCPVQ
jgi:hypothetical protein